MRQGLFLGVLIASGVVLSAQPPFRPAQYLDGALPVNAATFVFPNAPGGGQVFVEATITTTGRISDLKILRISPTFAEPFVEAIRTWRLTRAITQGRRAALLTVVGLGCGVFLHTVLAVVGLSALVRSSYLAFRIVKYGGSLYLIGLGVISIRSSNALGGQPGAGAVPPATRVIRHSIIASMTNPKTIIFFVSFLPQFVDPAAGAVTSQLLVFGLLYLLVTLAVYGLLAMTAGRVGRLLRERGAVAERLRWGTAGSFIGLGAWSALSDAR